MVSSLGIIAGNGNLPKRLIEACERQSRPYFILAFEDNTDEKIVENKPHNWVRLGGIGYAIDILRENNCTEIVMAGKIERPSLASLRPDIKATKLLAKLGKGLFAGDDRLLSIIVKFLEEEGFKIIGVEEILDDILTPIGLIGKIYPDKQARADIEIGARIAQEIGKLDIGQAVIIEQGHILGVEAMEGTDKLIKRCSLLKQNPNKISGVLVKTKKPYQEKRVDLPTIGEITVQNIANAGFSGIAIEAGGSLIIDRKSVELEANRLGIFIIGFTCSDV